MGSGKYQIVTLAMTNYLSLTQKELLDSIVIPPVPTCETILNLYERLKCFIYKLSIEPIPENSDSALSLINSTLISVEDCHSGVAAETNPGLKKTGRMYPIQEDYVQRNPNGSIVALSRAHRILIEPTGEYSILTRKDDEVIIKRNHEAV